MPGYVRGRRRRKVCKGTANCETRESDVVPAVYAPVPYTYYMLLELHGDVGPQESQWRTPDYTNYPRGQLQVQTLGYKSASVRPAVELATKRIAAI